MQLAEVRYLEYSLEMKCSGRPFITKLYRQPIYTPKTKLWSRTSVLQRYLLAVFEHTLKHASQWLQAASFGKEKAAKPCPYSPLGSWDPSLPTKHLPKSWPEGSSEAAFKSKQLGVKALSISTL